MRKAVAAASALMMVAAMTGCSSGDALDREIALGNGASLSVSSGWEQMDGADFSEDSGFEVFKRGEGEEGIHIEWLSESSGPSPAERIENMRKSAEGDGATEWESEIVEEKVVSGAKCTIYRYSYKIGTDDCIEDGDSYKAFIVMGNGDEVDIYGSDDLGQLKRIVDTVTFE